MKKEDIPQDPSPLDKFTKEVCYAVNSEGKYTTELSRGWQVKAEALGITWDEAQKRIEEAKQKMLSGEVSPVLYFMELNLMDIAIVSAYTGFWQWSVKRHMKPLVFHKLSQRKLEKYAEVFDVTVEELKAIQKHGN